MDLILGYLGFFIILFVFELCVLIGIERDIIKERDINE